MDKDNIQKVIITMLVFPAFMQLINAGILLYMVLTR